MVQSDSFSLFDEEINRRDVPALKVHPMVVGTLARLVLEIWSVMCSCFCHVECQSSVFFFAFGHHILSSFLAR